MVVTINGKEIEVPMGCSDLEQLLKTQHVSGISRRVTVNGRAVPRTAWHDVELSEGMEINTSRLSPPAS